MSTAGASPSGTEIAGFLCAPQSAKDLRSSGLDSLEKSAADRNTMTAFWGGCSPASNLCFLRLQSQSQSQSPWAGILLSVILFSPRSLLPGQMNTNAFRSSTDKEWTRFRGSNVSGLSFFLFNLRQSCSCFQLLYAKTAYEGCCDPMESLAGIQIDEIELATAPTSDQTIRFIWKSGSF